MDMNNALLALTKKKVITVSNINIAAANVDASVRELTTKSNINVQDTATINGKDVDLFGVISDERLIEKFSKNKLSPSTVALKLKPVRLATTYKNLSASEINNIKTVLYEMCVENGTALPGGANINPNNPPSDDNSEDDYTPENQYTPKGGSEVVDSNPGAGATFIKNNDFCDTKSMFTWLKANNKVASETQITRAELVALT